VGREAIAQVVLFAGIFGEVVQFFTLVFPGEVVHFANNDGAQWGTRTVGLRHVEMRLYRPTRR